MKKLFSIPAPGFVCGAAHAQLTVLESGRTLTMNI